MSPAGIFETELECPICGGIGFAHQDVLWQELIAAWQLQPEEVAYINRQQGSLCRKCGGNIRSGALAKALCNHLHHDGTFDQLLEAPPDIRILEVNEAGTLHSRLKALPAHVFTTYPACDLTAMTFDDESFEIIVHSDTLEHVEAPERAMREIHRVLVEGGATIFTVPIVVGRLSRSRKGLPPAYHGAPCNESLDLQVHTEFGTDLWCMLIEAGFSDCRFIPFQYPAGIAVVATK